ncbi:MAG: hypothetical protein K0Q55_405 [Verrucomicrobia bacterium]|jgi:hypothetical protein|nr:hypothetical protein [Verrucomicrobiota bacterium]
MQVLELKIQCACGARFAFEVQPVHGRMPSTVACPRCGCDHTEDANLQIARSLAPPPLYDGRRGLKILNLPGYNLPDPEPDQMLVSIPQPGIQTLPVGGKTNRTTELDIPITDNTSAAPHLQDAVDAAISASQVPIIPGGSGAPAAEGHGSSGPAAPAPGGLRVRQSKKGQTTTVIPPPLPPPEDALPVLKRKPAAAAPVYDDDPPQGVLGWIKASGKAIATTAIAFLVVLKFIGKLKLAKILAIFGIGAASNTPTDLRFAADGNFGFLDETQIYVRADDSKKVVDACVAYWSTQGKTLNVKESDGETTEPKHYLVTPVHEGYVAILGDLEWDPKFVDGLAQSLSMTFNSTVMTMAEDDLGSHRFAVYQSGQKNFAHQLDVQVQGRDLKTSFKMENENWVVEQGYFKPDSKGFENFDFAHVDQVSRKLGLKWWTFPDDAKGFHDLSE